MSKVEINIANGERWGLFSLPIKENVQNYKLSSIEAFKGKHILGIYAPPNMGHLYQNEYGAGYSLSLKDPKGETLVEHSSKTLLQMNASYLLSFNLGIVAWDKSEIVLEEVPTSSENGKVLYLYIHYKKD